MLQDVEYCERDNIWIVSPIVLLLPPLYWTHSTVLIWYPSTELNQLSTYRYNWLYPSIVLMVSAHGTKHPPIYWLNPSTVLMMPPQKIELLIHSPGLINKNIENHSPIIFQDKLQQQFLKLRRNISKWEKNTFSICCHCNTVIKFLGYWNLCFYVLQIFELSQILCFPHCASSLFIALFYFVLFLSTAQNVKG